MANGNGIYIGKGIMVMLALVLSALMFIAGTYTDLGRNKQRIATNERDISSIRQALNQNRDILVDIQERLARIEAKLELSER